MKKWLPILLGMLLVFVACTAGETGVRTENVTEASTENRITLEPGEYRIPDDIPVGRYRITAPRVGTVAGDFPEYPGIFFMLEMVGDKDGGHFGVPSYTVYLADGFELDLSSYNTEIWLDPVVESGTTTEPTTGDWIVGDDLPEGRFLLSNTGNQTGNYALYDEELSLLINGIMAPTTDENPGVVLELQAGHMLRLSGIKTAQLTETDEPVTKDQWFPDTETDDTPTGERITLEPGVYKVPDTLPEGRYRISSKYDGLLKADFEEMSPFNLIVSVGSTEEGYFGAASYPIYLMDGYILDFSDFTTDIWLDPMEPQGNLTELRQGDWLVGADVAPGTITLTNLGTEGGNLAVFDENLSLMENQILAGEGEGRNRHTFLANEGYIIRISSKITVQVEVQE